MENRTPIDYSVLNTVSMGGDLEVNLAVDAAAAAFSDWRNVSGAARRQLLHRIADAVEARAEEISLVESVDTGQAIRYMSKAAIRGAENFRFFADRAASARDGLHLPAANQLNYTVREPLGPVGVITPWNTPFMLSTWKIAPALAAGCTVVEAHAGLELEEHDDHEEHAEGHDDHDEHAEDEHAEEDHDHEEHAEDDHDHEEGGHSEFHAEYALPCPATGAVDSIVFDYFTAFPNAQELDIQLVTDHGATAAEVERDNPELALEGHN